MKHTLVITLLLTALVTVASADVFIGPSLQVPTAGQYSGNANTNLGFRFGFDFGLEGATQKGLLVDMNTAKMSGGTVNYLNFTFFDRYYLPRIAPKTFLYGVGGVGYTRVNADFMFEAPSFYSQHISVQDWFINLDLGFGVRYYITDRFSINLTPLFRYQLNDLVNDSAVFITVDLAYLLIP